jgi:hypothetical protein
MLAGRDGGNKMSSLPLKGHSGKIKSQIDNWHPDGNKTSGKKGARAHMCVCIYIFRPFWNQLKPDFYRLTVSYILGAL